MTPYVISMAMVVALASPSRTMALAGLTDTSSSTILTQGRAIYERACAWCHGWNGEGDGPQAIFGATFSGPRPRDFRHEPFKFRTTPSGELPTDQDLFRTITNGIAGYMPSFAGLSEIDRWYVIAYIKTFNPDFASETPEALSIGTNPIPPSPQSLARGRLLYRQFECHACHGMDGKGTSDLVRNEELIDSRGLPLDPTDLTNPTSFKNGASPRDIARSILTGLDGTPMPSYLDTMENPEDVWHLVNYILSLSPHVP